VVLTAIVVAASATRAAGAIGAIKETMSTIINR
jgi:hypothetical protein